MQLLLAQPYCIYLCILLYSMNGNPGQMLYTCVCVTTLLLRAANAQAPFGSMAVNRVRKLNDSVKSLQEVIWRRK